MQEEIDNSMTVKLNKMAYEIDFDAYWLLGFSEPVDLAEQEYKNTHF